MPGPTPVQDLTNFGCTVLFASSRRHPEFNQSYACARDVRADFTFGEQIISIADDAEDDWIAAKNGGAPRINKELVLRSKIRIEARRFHMSRLHPETWGDKQTLDVKNDWNLLSAAAKPKS